jgi:hypothetical protein
MAKQLNKDATEALIAMCACQRFDSICRLVDNPDSDSTCGTTEIDCIGYRNRSRSGQANNID